LGLGAVLYELIDCPVIQIELSVTLGVQRLGKLGNIGNLCAVFWVVLSAQYTALGIEIKSEQQRMLRIIQFD